MKNMKPNLPSNYSVAVEISSEGNSLMFAHLIMSLVPNLHNAMLVSSTYLFTDDAYNRVILPLCT